LDDGKKPANAFEQALAVNPDLPFLRGNAAVFKNALLRLAIARRTVAAADRRSYGMENRVRDRCRF
jgi:hypothetical protein